MLELLILMICTGILASGLLAVFMKHVVAALVCSGLASLFASLSFLLIAAPDVAMAEAAVGSGLTTVIFLYAIRKTAGGEA